MKRSPIIIVKKSEIKRMKAETRDALWELARCIIADNEKKAQLKCTGLTEKGNAL